MDFFKSKNNQALITSMSRARMYDSSRPSEVNSDGCLQKSDEASGWRQRDAAILNDMIEKGEISDTLASGYGSPSPIVVTKTGKEIKEKAPAIISALEAEKKNLETQLLALQQEAGLFPDQPVSRKYSKTTPFNKYDWSLAESKYVNGEYEPKTPQQIACGKYNSLVWMYTDICDDIDAMQIIAKNLQDSKSYNFSVSQLIALKF